MGAATAVWGSCRFCGTAVAPGAAVCGICGADGPVRAGTFAQAPRSVRRRIVLTGTLRTLIVVGVAVALAYTLIANALSGPPTVADPLTTSGTYTVGPGQAEILQGAVTGGDYIVGNFTSVRPFGADIAFEVYNSTEWNRTLAGENASIAYTTGNESAARIVFSAEYTDNYTFVLVNPYPASSHLNITVYVATQYESNVGDDGFG